MSILPIVRTPAHLACAVAAALVAAVPRAAVSQGAVSREAAPGDPATRPLPGTTRGPVQLPPVPPGQHVTGALFIGYRGTDGATTGGIVTVSPVAPAFVRLGAEVTPRSPDGPVRLLWGLGLEDWREGTFFLDVHDWGPVRPDRSFTLRHAEASAGYKVPRACRGAFCVVPVGFATLPFDGGPYVGARTAFTVGRTWFVSTAIGWTLPGVLPGSAEPQAWRLSFALGRWDGAPGGLFGTYRDDVSTRQLGDRRHLYREGRGVLATGVNWGY